MLGRHAAAYASTDLGQCVGARIPYHNAKRVERQLGSKPHETGGWLNRTCADRFREMDTRTLDAVASGVLCLIALIQYML